MRAERQANGPLAIGSTGARCYRVAIRLLSPLRTPVAVELRLVEPIAADGDLLDRLSRAGELGHRSPSLPRPDGCGAQHGSQPLPSPTLVWAGIVNSILLESAARMNQLRSGKLQRP